MFALLLTACAGTPQSDRLRSAPPAGIPDDIELEQVAFHPQEAYQCGPAALATMLNHQHIKVEPDDLVGKVYLPERKGSLQIEMIATARSYGLLPYPLAPSLEALLSELAAGRPVLLFQNLSLPILPVWHYAVAVGYDLERRMLILRSGTEKRHIVDFSTFERTWQRAGHWAYVFVRPGEIPASATAARYIRAVHQAETGGQAATALAAYRQAGKHWPDTSMVQMALGNAEYAGGDYAAADAAFARAIAIDASNAQAWNNLAYALVAQQCRVAAIKAISCAVRLAPEDDNIRHSLQEIISQRDIPAGSCDLPQCPQFLQ